MGSSSSRPSKAPLSSRGELPNALVERVLHLVDEDCERRGWDQPAQLFALAWSDADPGLTAMADQEAAELRDALSAPPDSVTAAAVRLEPLGELTGDPATQLTGYRAPADADAVALVTEIWTYPDDVVAAGGQPDLPPAEHPRRIEGRFTCLVDRSGAMHALLRRRGEDANRVPVTDLSGRVPDALRRVLGLHTGALTTPPAALLARVFLSEVAKAPAPIDEATVAALDPADRFLAALEASPAPSASSAEEAPAPSDSSATSNAPTPSGQPGGAKGVPGAAASTPSSAPLPPPSSLPPSLGGPLAELVRNTPPEQRASLRTALGKELAGALSWKGVQRFVREHGEGEDAFNEWADEAMLGERLLAQYPSEHELLERIAARHGRPLADQLVAELAERGWLDRPAPESTRRPPPRTGRNAACPCGSGRKYKHCHGAAVPLVLRPSP